MDKLELAILSVVDLKLPNISSLLCSSVFTAMMRFYYSITCEITNFLIDPSEL